MKDVRYAETNSVNKVPNVPAAGVSCVANAAANGSRIRASVTRAKKRTPDSSGCPRVSFTFRLIWNYTLAKKKSLKQS